MKRILKIFGVTVLLAGTIFFSFVALLWTNASRPAHPVGVQQVKVDNPGHAPVMLTIFYPTTVTPKHVWLGTSFAELAPSATVTSGRHALIVMSHGSGGTPTGHLDTVLALVDAGYVVAAPLHNGDNFQDTSAVGSKNWIADRAGEILRVNDYMLTNWKDRAQVDPERIGLFGFSAGGTTGLVTIGGRLELSRLDAHCKATPEFVCTLLPPGIVGANTDSPKDVSDSRVKAAVIVAPGLGFTFAAVGLADSRARVQLWDGEHDTQTPPASNVELVRKLLPGSPEFHLVPNAGHFAFLAPCGLMAPALPKMLCDDPEGFDRAAFHVQFNQSVVAYFGRALPEAH